MVPRVRRASRTASAATRRSPPHQGQVAGLDRHVGAGAHGQAEVGLGERGGVVDAVADHGHDPALGLQAASPRRPCRPAARRRRPARCRPRRRSARAARSLSPVSSTGVSPSSRSARTPCAEVGLRVSATTRTPAGAPVPGDRHGGPAAGLGAASTAARRSSPSAAPCSASSRGRPSTTSRPSTVPRTPSPSRLAKSVTSGREGTSAPATRLGRHADPSAMTLGSADVPPEDPGHDGPGDGVLGGGLDRGGHAAYVVLVLAGRRRPPPTRLIRPVVTVPVLSSTTVSTRRVDSSTSGPLIRMPSCAPRPVPTISAVGVARPERAGAGDDQHGDGGAEGGGRPAAERPASRPG